MGRQCDFSGLATRYNTRCSDGRTIRSGAFADMDGKEIPIVWNHNHSDPSAVVGKGILHSVDEGCRVDGWFSNSSKAKDAKENLLAGVPMTLSIHATNLKQNGTEVLHGIIREVSLVLAGANPGAVIDHVSLAHADGFYSEDEALICWEENVEIMHSEDEADPEPEEPIEDPEVEADPESEEASEEPAAQAESKEEPESTDEGELEHAEEDIEVSAIIDSMNDKQKAVMEYLVGLALTGDTPEIEHADKESEDEDEAEAKSDSEDDSDGETIQDVVDSMNEQQKNVMFALIGAAKEEHDGKSSEKDEDDEKEGGKEMAHTNIFDAETKQQNVITHADQEAIMARAQDSSCGSFQKALAEFMNEHNMGDELEHGFTNESMEYLFPDYKDPNGDGEPWTLTRDMSWEDRFLNATHKTPYSKIKTRYIDATGTGIRARGYRKGDEKDEIGDVEVLHRETTSQTVYVKDSIDRDDIIDFTDFSIVAYIDKTMTMALKEELAIAMLFGDGREKNAKDKIKEDHIRPIWTDDETYVIHKTIDLDATRSEIQGTNTGAYFGENYIWAETFVNDLLYAREKYKGSGSITAYMAPHTVNVMLLARDMNGRRIYGNVNELKAALNVKEIVTVEQMDNLTREVTEDGATKTKKLLAIFVDEKDYNVGTNKGGEITSFKDFDIDFNKEKYLKETRCSGALVRIKSAIVMEQDVTAADNAQG